MSQPPSVTASGSGIRNAAFNIAQAANSFVSSSVANGPSANTNTSAFKVPAHKHAHHLHSIPPREKSTRTLIIDHMLWVHGRTRFAQARAELGMTDRTGGPSSSNYIHRRRPENYEEEYEVGSDGEDVITLKARSGRPNNPHDDYEDNHLHHQDLKLAQSLRLRAEGLEKVVSSMLDQPPPVHPVVDENIWTPPTSPKMSPSSGSTGSGSHPHTLPDGVRLRLALGTMINDLFARQAPPPPFRHQQASEPPTRPNFPLPQGLPPALSSISSLSAYSSSSRPGYLSAPVRIARLNTLANPHSIDQTRKQVAKPGPRTQLLYNEGADPSTANSPPAFRCPRHLHTGCEICVEIKSAGRPSVGGIRGRSNSIGETHSFPRASAAPPPTWKGMSGVIGIAPDGGGVSGWQDGSGIGSGLAAPGKDSSVLRRRNPFTEEGLSSGAGSTKLTELIPRFLRLSALVAAELGRESKEEQGSPETFDEGWTNPTLMERAGEFTLPPAMSASTVQAVAEAQDKMYANVLRPSRQWYMLFGGLLTRAALEGYLSAGWRGSDAVECLLTCGLGVSQPQEEQEDEFKWFEPDELPALHDAVKMLFPGLRGLKRDQPEEEFEAEMDERLRRFYDIPASTPDLSTHMEDLAWQYPAEPVERAAVRFCEAIAKWRGKPELETYKKKPTSSAPPMTIESLVHSNPTSPTMGNAQVYPQLQPPPRAKKKPSIDAYFVMNFPGSVRGGGAGTGKRMRSPDDPRPNGTKRVHL